MCGRFTTTLPSAELARELGLPLPPGYRPRYNVAPQQLSVVLYRDEHGAHQCRLLQWGLVPFWADDPGIGSRMINARSETVAGKPAYRAAYKRRRCLVPVDGFYEWVAVPGEARKQPFWIHLESRSAFTLAGLWERWDKGGEPLETFTILTCGPNDRMRPLHHRMPVIVPRASREAWLNGDTPEEALKSLLCPYAGDDLEVWPVSVLVNSPGHDSPDCIVELRDLDADNVLRAGRDGGGGHAEQPELPLR